MALRMAAATIQPLPTPAAPQVRTVTAQKQYDDNWCWAACCSMAVQAAGLPLARPQCKIAGSYLGTSAVDCCKNKACDIPCKISDVASVFAINGLTNTQMLANSKGPLPPPSEQDLAVFLTQSSVAVGLLGTQAIQGINHMVLVVRQTEQNQFVVANPADGSLESVPYAEILKPSVAPWVWTWTWTDLR